MNAHAHGRGPVRVRIWAGDERVLASVVDHGTGPDDPFAGLLPVERATTRGRGLWIAHQLCSHLTMERGRDEFAISLVVGAPYVA